MLIDFLFIRFIYAHFIYFYLLSFIFIHFVLFRFNFRSFPFNFIQWAICLFRQFSISIQPPYLLIIVSVLPFHGPSLLASIGSLQSLLRPASVWKLQNFHHCYCSYYLDSLQCLCASRVRRCLQPLSDYDDGHDGLMLLDWAWAPSHRRQLSVDSVKKDP